MKKTAKRTLEAATAPTIADVAAQGRRLAEQAALVDAVNEELRRLFLGERPARLLVRQGEGPRRADVDALTEVDLRLNQLAEEYREQARRLLAMTVAPAPSSVVVTGTSLIVDDAAIDAASSKSNL